MPPDEQVPPAGTVGGLSVRSGLQPGLAGGKNDVTGAGAVGTPVERLERPGTGQTFHKKHPSPEEKQGLERLERVERL